MATYPGFKIHNREKYEGKLKNKKNLAQNIIFIIQNLSFH
jgi:hypothetical protein